jgi:hypothetical protein
LRGYAVDPSFLGRQFLLIVGLGSIRLGSKVCRRWWWRGRTALCRHWRGNRFAAWDRRHGHITRRNRRHVWRRNIIFVLLVGIVLINIWCSCRNRRRWRSRS